MYILFFFKRITSVEQGNILINLSLFHLYSSHSGTKIKIHITRYFKDNLYVLEYVDRLMTRVVETCRQPAHQWVLNEGEKIPPPLCQEFEHPDKATAIQQHVQRFHNN